MRLGGSIDTYGKPGGWTYRLFSILDTEPDVGTSGKRHLTIHAVVWAGFLKAKALYLPNTCACAPGGNRHSPCGR
jgi:hypothetical protein